MRNPFENPDESFAHSPEYLAGLLQNCEEEREQISELYSLMREALVEEEAWKIHGIAARHDGGKSIGECRTIASYRLRVPCAACENTGTIVVNQERDAAGRQNLTTCKKCEGSGVIMLPAIEWMREGKVQFALLPKDHPDYDPTK